MVAIEVFLTIELAGLESTIELRKCKWFDRLHRAP